MFMQIVVPTGPGSCVQPVAESGCGEIMEGDVAAVAADVVAKLNIRTDDISNTPIEEEANAVFE
jgi:hypothetical protein